MTRKSLVVGTGIVLAVIGGVSAVVVLLVLHEPADYRRAATQPTKERKVRSDEFKSEFSHLVNEVLYEETWRARFTEDQINSYFDEDLGQTGGQALLPPEIREPRVSIHPDKIRLAFRYGNKSWNTVITIDTQIWLVAKQLNVVAVEVQGLRAGMLPISAQSFLEQVSESARQKQIDVTWYRHNGNPVALMRFQADKPRPTFALQMLSLGDGVLEISGRAVDSSSLRAMFAPLGVTPTMAAN